MTERKWFYNVQEVMSMFNIGRTTLWKLMKKNKFPKPVKGITSKLQFSAQEIEEFYIDMMDWNGKKQFITKKDGE